MFLQASVILSTGGVCLSACWDARPPPTRQTPPGPGRPPRDQADTCPGPGRPPPQDQADTTPPDQADPSPPGPGRFPPGPGRPPPGTRQTPPPGPGRPPSREADASIRSMSGRYASYWNAFLFYFVSFWVEYCQYRKRHRKVEVFAVVGLNFTVVGNRKSVYFWCVEA